MSHFDSKAKEWDTNPVFQERGRRIATAIRTRVRLHRGMKALDYGCGTGLLSFPLRDAVGEITLADSSEGMLEVLRQKIAAQAASNMTACKLDLLSDPLPTSRFDLIYTSMTLHHVPATDRILGLFHTLLSPGGHLCVADLDTEDGSFHGPDVDVHHGFDRRQLANLAGQAGFEDIDFETVFEIVRPQPEGERAYTVFLMLAQRR